MKILIMNNEMEKLKSRDLIPIECDICGIKFFREKHYIQASIKRGVKNFRCTGKCRQKKGKVVKCNYCGKEIYKLPTALKEFTNHYCSRKCACGEASRIRWKNHIPDYNKCPKCGKRINYRTKFCQSCFNLGQKEENKNITIIQLKEKYKNKFNGWYSSEIRNYNRVWNRHLLDLGCQVCGYNKHIELCHIKSIKSFNGNSTMKEVNHEKNNLVLCPNHHWEFDSGILKLKDIPKRNGEADRS
jgi:hypothetical protein